MPKYRLWKDGFGLSVWWFQSTQNSLHLQQWTFLIGLPCPCCLTFGSLRWWFLRRCPRAMSRGQWGIKWTFRRWQVLSFVSSIRLVCLFFSFLFWRIFQWASHWSGRSQMSLTFWLNLSTFDLSCNPLLGDQMLQSRQLCLESTRKGGRTFMWTLLQVK